MEQFALKAAQCGGLNDFQGTVHGEHERTAGVSDGPIDVSGNSKNAARAHRDSDSGSRHERHAKIRRGGANIHGKRARMPDFADYAINARTTGLVDPSENGGRTAVQDCLHQRPQPGPVGRGSGVSGAFTVVLANRLSSGRLGLIDRAQANHWTNGGQDADGGRPGDTLELFRNRFDHQEILSELHFAARANDPCKR